MLKLFAIILSFQFILTPPSYAQFVPNVLKNAKKELIKVFDFNKYTVVIDDEVTEVLNFEDLSQLGTSRSNFALDYTENDLDFNVRMGFSVKHKALTLTAISKKEGKIITTQAVSFTDDELSLTEADDEKVDKAAIKVRSLIKGLMNRLEQEHYLTAKSNIFQKLMSFVLPSAYAGKYTELATVLSVGVFIVFALVALSHSGGNNGSNYRYATTAIMVVGATSIYLIGKRVKEMSEFI